MPPYPIATETEQIAPQPNQEASSDLVSPETKEDETSEISSQTSITKTASSIKHGHDLPLTDSTLSNTQEYLDGKMYL